MFLLHYDLKLINTLKLDKQHTSLQMGPSKKHVNATFNTVSVKIDHTDRIKLKKPLCPHLHWLHLASQHSFNFIRVILHQVVSVHLHDLNDGLHILQFLRGNKNRVWMTSRVRELPMKSSCYTTNIITFASLVFLHLVVQRWELFLRIETHENSCQEVRIQQSQVIMFLGCFL